MTARPTYLRKTANGWLALAPAKLNLYLEVLGRRSDGFHELETLITPIGLFDTLEAEPRGDGQVRLRVEQAASPAVAGGGEVPADKSNLVVRALDELRRRLRDAHGMEATRGIDVRLVKRIPNHAGLGGGSSDAAAALELGQRLWGRRLPEDELLDVAAGLGSDVPFFLARSTAVCRGRGERIEALGLPTGAPCVLVQPPIGLGAGEVFSELKRDESAGGERASGDARRLPRLIDALASGRLRDAGRWMLNRLQPAATRLAKQRDARDWYGRLAERFRRLPVAAHQMTGSGSVYFGLCENWRAARRAAARLRGEGFGWVGLAATC